MGREMLERRPASLEGADRMVDDEEEPRHDQDGDDGEERGEGPPSSGATHCDSVSRRSTSA